MTLEQQAYRKGFNQGWKLAIEIPQVKQWFIEYNKIPNEEKRNWVLNNLKTRP